MNIKDEQTPLLQAEQLDDAALSNVVGGADADGTQYVLGDTVRFRVTVIVNPHTSATIIGKDVVKTGTVFEYTNGYYVIISDDGKYNVPPSHILGSA